MMLGFCLQSSAYNYKALCSDSQPVALLLCYVLKADSCYAHTRHHLLGARIECLQMKLVQRQYQYIVSTLAEVQVCSKARNFNC